MVPLIILDMLDFDVILAMTWLSPYHVVLNSNAKTVTLSMNVMDKLGWEGVYKDKSVKIISFVCGRMLVGIGCSTLVDLHWDTGIGSSLIESVSLVSKFWEVFSLD